MLNRRDRGIKFAMRYRKPVRTGPDFVLRHKSRIKPLHCIRHTYWYIEDSYIDELTGTVYAKGYYDETGAYYESLDLDYCSSDTKLLCKCEYCESTTYVNINELEIGDTLKCECCGASLDVANALSSNKDYFVCDENGAFHDEMMYSYEESDYQEIKNTAVFFRFVRKMVGVWAVTLLLSFVFAFLSIPFGMIAQEEDKSYQTEEVANSTYYDYSVLGDSVYVPEIDRTCEWDGDYYYDYLTDCYFCYNTDVVPAQMQYWYEGFSSDYGDYGWLEYYEDEDAWYVETGLNQWEKLEEVPEYFWHTTFDNLESTN